MSCVILVSVSVNINYYLISELVYFSINMELDPSLQLQQALHFWEDFLQDFGLCLWECVQPKEPL